MTPVTTIVDSSVAVLTMAGGEGGNRLNPDLLGPLAESLRKTTKDPEVRAIVLRSNGPAFCLGMDLDVLAKTLEGKDKNRIHGISEAIALYSNLLATIREAPKPVVCIVEGEVRAGGMGLVCAADIVLAGADASFCLSEVLFGLIPANVLPYLLSQRVSAQRARYLVLTAKTLSPEEAQKDGIVDEVLAAANPEGQVRRLLKQLLRGGPAALAEAKRFIGEAEDLTAIRKQARETLLRLVESDEFRGAVAAFQEGQTPDWYPRYRPEHKLTGGADPSKSNQE